MLEVQQFVKALKDWKNQNQKQIGDILKRIQTLKMPEEEKSIAIVRDCLVVFYMEINKADEVDESWFPDVLKAKKHIKKLEEDFKKALKAPKIIKKDSQIQFPELLLNQKDQRKRLILKKLYKNFMVNLTEETSKRTKEIIQFLCKLLDFVYKLFKLENKYVQDHNTSGLFDRLSKIENKFLQIGVTQAKVQMIQGLKSPELVAELHETAFLSEEAQRRIKKKQEQFARRNQTGFYDAMKKNINKDANQQCRKCKKNTAYCEDMKQTRASDQPMTKFMKCNSCGHQWRCE